MARVAPRRRLAFQPEAMALLQAQDYRGNVRELRNLLERISLLCDGSAIEAVHVQQALQSGRRPTAATPALAAAAMAFGAGDAGTAAPEAAIGQGLQTLQATEKRQLQQLLDSHTGSRAELAAQLGISERSLYRKLKTLSIPLL